MRAAPQIDDKVRETVPILYREEFTVDKYEYKLKSEQMLEFMEDGEYKKAAEIADTIDWRRVRNATMLMNVSDIYEKNREYHKSYDILNIAYQRAEGSRKILYRLCVLALKTRNVDEAIDYYDEFIQIAPKDPNRYLLRYQILRARREPIEQQIEALEAFKKGEYVEEWAYELAKLYQEAGMTAECLEECDDLILWFSEGKYVYQAMELKMQYKPLTPSQQEKYNRRYEKVSGVTEEIPDVVEYQEKKEAAADENAELSEVKSEDVPIKKIGNTMKLDEALKVLLHLEPSADQRDTEDMSDLAAKLSEEDAEDLVDENLADENLAEEDLSGLEESMAEIESISEIVVAAEPRRKAPRTDMDRDLEELLPEPELEETVSESEETVSDSAVEQPAEASGLKDMEPDLEEILPAAAETDKKDDDQIEGQMSLEDILQDWQMNEQKEAAAEKTEDHSETEKTSDTEEAKKTEEESKTEQAAQSVNTEESDEEPILPPDILQLIEEIENGVPAEYEEEPGENLQMNDLEDFEDYDEELDDEFADEFADELEEESFEELTEEELETEAAEELTEELETEAAEDLTEEDLETEPAEELTEEELETEAAEELTEEELETETAEELTEEELETEAAEELTEEELENDSDEGFLDSLVDELDDDSDEGFLDEWDEDFLDELSSHMNDSIRPEIVDDLPENLFEEERDSEESEEDYEEPEEDYEESEEDYEEPEEDYEEPEEEYKETELEEDYDDREIPDEDDDKINFLSETAPLSRKETAKLYATGKTAPIPIDEISDALSMSDTGFVVHGRYDLRVQSGIGTRAGLTEDQKKLFSYFVPVRGMSEQLVDVLEQDKNCTNRKGTSATGNLLIIGNKGNGKTVLAVDVVKAIQKQRNIRQGKVAIVSGDSLNKKRISDIFSKLYGGALIIEKAGKMNEKTVVRLNKAMEQDSGELLVVLEDQRKPLDRLLTSNREFRRKFTSRLEVPILINDELVTFGQTYAKENGYLIDEMGILALYSRIDELQREDHPLTIAEVKEVIDEAMEHSQKVSAKKLIRRVLGRGTDSNDRIILGEADFLG